MAKNIFGPLVYSNIFIALVAFSMIYRTDRLWNLDLSFSVYLILFFSTLFVYSLYSLVSPHEFHTGKRSWSKKNKWFLLINLLVSFGAILFLMCSNERLLLFITPAIFLTSYYLIPRLNIFISGKNKIYFKTIILVLAWLYATTIFPLLSMKREIITIGVMGFIGMEFCFLYLICYLFEHRDRLTDPQHYVWFNPHKQANTILGTFTFLFFTSVFIAFLGRVDNKYLIYKIGLLLFIVFTFNKSLVTKSDIWFYLVLDGMMGADALLFLF